MTILMYHKIDLESPTIWWVSVDQFYRQMLELKSKKVVYLDDYNPQDSNHMVITFDGIYRNVLDYAAPILQRFNYPYELFISSDYIGSDNAFDTVEPLAQFVDMQGLKALVNMNGRLQWHTKSHPDLTVENVITNISDELDIPQNIRELDPKGFNWFAYPYGRFNEKVLSSVRDKFSGAVSCEQGNDLDRYCFNRLTVTSDSKLSTAKIAIIIASYNYGSFLIEAIESVLRQTRLPDEILISDDASSDNTYEIASLYQSKYPNLIRVNRNEQNMGIVDHFNKAIGLTRSQYVTILGADNRYRSDFIEKTAAILDAHEDVAIAYTDFALFGQRAKLVYESCAENTRGIVKAGKFYVINFPDFDENSRKQLIEVGNFIHGSSMFRRKAFDEVGGYIQVPSVPEDYALFRRIVKSGWLAYRSPFPLLEYRQHSRYQTNIQLGSFGELQFYKQLSKNIRAELNRSQTQLELTQSELNRSQSQLELTQSELNRSQAQLELTQSELNRSQAIILTMEDSKFWKLRKMWFRLKNIFLNKSKSIILSKSVGSKNNVVSEEIHDSWYYQRFPNLRALRVFTVLPGELRINLVTDSINSGSLYGGVATAIIFCTLLAQKWNCKLRVITRTERAHEINFFDILRNNGISCSRNVEFSFANVAKINSTEMDVSEKDIFVTTSWWTTWSTLQSISPKKIVYLLQEDERMFYPHGEDHLLATQTILNSNIRFLINTRQLFDHFIREGFTNIKEQGSWFEPAFSKNTYYLDKTSGKREKKKFFFYARPNNLRNLFYLGLEVIDCAVSRGILNLDEWDLFFVGKDIPLVKIGGSCNPIRIQGLNWIEYAQFIRSVDLGLCLMYTPHPSYPPLDLAASGGVVVTNRFGIKENLDAYSKNIICKEPNVESLVQGIDEGIKISCDMNLRYQNFEENNFIQDWNTSFEKVMIDLLN